MTTEPITIAAGITIPAGSSQVWLRLAAADREDGTGHSAQGHIAAWVLIWRGWS
jgi:hypothetical protein